MNMSKYIKAMKYKELDKIKYSKEVAVLKIHRGIKNMAMVGSEMYKIEGFDMHYFMDILGNVRHKFDKGIVRKHWLQRDQRYIVDLMDNTGKIRRLCLVYMIAKILIDNPNGYNYVEFLNQDKKDLRLSNIRWIPARQITKRRSRKCVMFRPTGKIYANLDVAIFATRYTKHMIITQTKKKDGLFCYVPNAQKYAIDFALIESELA